MRFSTLLAGAAVGAGVASAQNMTAAPLSICDKYTTALLKNNTAANQYTLLTLLVNTVGLGNFTGPGSPNPTLPGSLIKVPGILAPGVYNGEAVNLVPYFDGSLKSSNRGGKAVAINFLDGGGAAPIVANPLSSGTPGSNQYILFTHLYQYFGLLLGCSGVGTSGFPAYMGVQSMAQVHAFMDLDTAQNSWFIENVGLAALSFGVSMDDVKTVGTTLNNTFGYRCAPKVQPIAMYPPTYESICQNVTCPIATGGDCGNAAPAVMPMPADKMNMTSSSAAAGMMSSSMMSSSMMSGSSMMATGSSMMGASASKTGASAVMTAGPSGTATGVATYSPGANAGAAVAPAGVLALVGGLFAFLL